MTFTTESPAAVGIVGYGNISARYVKGLSRFSVLNAAGCADVEPEVAKRLASETGIRAYPSVKALHEDLVLDIVVNITTPMAHCPPTSAARLGDVCGGVRPACAGSSRRDEQWPKPARRAGSRPHRWRGDAQGS